MVLVDDYTRMTAVDDYTRMAYNEKTSRSTKKWLKMNWIQKSNA
jgi:hypothetical protein